MSLVRIIETVPEGAAAYPGLWRARAEPRSLIEALLPTPMMRSVRLRKES